MSGRRFNIPIQPTVWGEPGTGSAPHDRLRGGTALGTLSPLMAIALASCGGGGGGGGISATGGGMSGNLVNGPISGADIWLDTNNNGMIDPDSDFFVGTTGEDGGYSNANPPQGWHLHPLLADLNGAIDRGLLPNDDSDDSPVSGLWRAPKGSTVISPITDILGQAERNPGNTRLRDLKQVIETQLEDRATKFNYAAPNVDSGIAGKFHAISGFIRTSNPNAAELEAEITRMNAPPTDLALETTTITLPEGTTVMRELAKISIVDDMLGANAPMLAPGPDNALFDVMGNSEDGWKLVLNDGLALDRETGGETRSVTVTVDTNRALEATFILRVRDVDESPPMFAEDAHVFVVPENTHGVVGRVEATDTDATARITYSIDPGSVALPFGSGPVRGTHGFTIDAKGDIRLPASLDGDAVGVYTLTVRATSNGRVATATVTVVVTDEDDQAPVFWNTAGTAPLGASPSYTFNVSEGQRSTVGRVVARDGDRTPHNNMVSFSFVGEDHGFWIDDRGRIGRRDFDHETGDRFDLTVRASSQGMSSTARVAVVVGDENDAPLFGSDGYAFHAKNMGTGALGTVAASDPDANGGSGGDGGADGDDEFTYAIKGEAHGYKIDPGSGEITRAEGGTGTTGWHELTVVAASNLRHAETTVVLSSSDLGDVITVMEGVSGEYMIQVDEFMGAATYSIASATRNGQDVDEGDRAWLTVSDAGMIRVAAGTDDGDVGVWTVTVEAAGGTLVGSPASTSLTIVVENAEEAPTLEVAASPVAIGEGDQRPLRASDLKATKVDADDAPEDMVFTLVMMTGDGRLEIDYDTRTYMRNGREFQHRSFETLEPGPAGTGGTFTQADLDAGLVRFTAGSENAGLAFTVAADGVASEKEILEFTVTPNGPPSAGTALGTNMAVNIHELHPLTKPVHRFDVPDGTTVRLADGPDNDNDNALFRIDDAGRVWSRVLLDYEAPVDLDFDNTYRIEVSHSAAGEAEMKTMLDVTVRDIALEEDGESLNTRTATGVDAFEFEYDDIPLAERPGEEASYIISGHAWSMPATGPLVLTWSFSLEPFYDYFSDSGPTRNALDTAGEYEHLRWVVEECLGVFEQHANIKFIEVANTPEGQRGDINIAFTPIDRDDDGFAQRGGGVAWFPVHSINQAEINLGYYPVWDDAFDLTDIARIRHFRDDGYTEANIGWYIVLHELGHILGLKHPWETGSRYNHWPGNDRTDTDKPPYSENTIMDYNREPTRPGYPRTDSLGGVSAKEIGSADIEALQFLYGAPGPENDWTDGVGRFMGYSRGVRDTLAAGGRQYDIRHHVTVDENIPGGAAGAVVFEVEEAPGFLGDTKARASSYSLASGVHDNDLFMVDGATGEVRFRTPPDFEIPRDRGSDDAMKYDRDNGYVVIVTETRTFSQAGRHTVDHGYLVTVEDVDDTAPAGNRAPWAGTAMGGRIVAEGAMMSIPIPDSAFQDPEEDDTLVYSLVSVLKGWETDSVIPGWLTVGNNNGTGTVEVGGTMPTDDGDIGTYLVTVGASDGNPGNAMAETSFTLEISDVNEHSPVLAAAATPIGVAAGGRYVLVGSNTDGKTPDLEATDMDGGDGPGQLVYRPTLPVAGGGLYLRNHDGVWERLGASNNPSTFTQKQVDDGLVRFDAPATPGTVSVRLDVRDDGSRASEPQTLRFLVAENTAPRKGDDIGVLVFNKGNMNDPDELLGISSRRIPDSAFEDAEDDDRLTYQLVGVEKDGEAVSTPPWLMVRTVTPLSLRGDTVGYVDVRSTTGDSDVGIYTVTVSASDGYNSAESVFHLVIADFA